MKLILRSSIYARRRAFGVCSALVARPRCSRVNHGHPSAVCLLWFLPVKPSLAKLLFYPVCVCYFTVSGFRENKGAVCHCGRKSWLRYMIHGSIRISWYGTVPKAELARLCVAVLFSIKSVPNLSRREEHRACVEGCQKTGSLKEASIKHCMVPADGQPADKSWYTHEPLYLQWKDWNCKSECRYHCMMERENERAKLGLQPVKYHGKWPLKRASVFQEPLSASLSALTLVVQFNGWLSFFLLLYYKLPLRPETHKTYYEYTGLWHIYGLLAMNSWFWSAIYHSCDTTWTEKLYFSSAAAFLGYSFILAILRTLNLRDEASRVMVAAPILAFVTTHILYLNFYELDKDLNMKVCTVISIAQCLLWALWAVMTRHPSRLKIIFVAIEGAAAVFLEAYDIPPRWGYVDGRAICLAVAIPLSFLWWSFAKEDAEMRTSAILKKTR